MWCDFQNIKKLLSSFYKKAEEGFINLWGIDYSEAAIELAKSIIGKKKLNIEYQVLLKIKLQNQAINNKLNYFIIIKVMDVLDKSQYPSNEFDIAIDKVDNMIY